MLLYWTVKTLCVVKAKQKHDVLKQNYDDMKTQLQQVQYSLSPIKCSIGPNEQLYSRNCLMV